MIGITSKTVYAVAAIYQLGSLEDYKTLKIKDIAQKANVPQKFLEQILLELKKSGLLNSSKGAHGGYRLAKSLEKIKLRDIIEILENDTFADVCKTGNETLKLFWCDIQTNLKNALNVPLSELKKNEEKLNQILNFSI